MGIRQKLLEVLSPQDERKELDHQIRLREMRLQKAEQEQKRLRRLAQMVEVKGSGAGDGEDV